MVPDDKILKDNYNVISIYDSCDHIVYHPTGDKHRECKLCGLNDFVLDRLLVRKEDEIMYNYLIMHPNVLKDADTPVLKKHEHIFASNTKDEYTCIICGEKVSKCEDFILCDIDLAKAIYLNIMEENPFLTASEAKVMIKSVLAEIRGIDPKKLSKSNLTKPNNHI